MAQLAIRFSNLAGLNEEQEKLVVVSALLHDIGHAPLSHSLESAFQEKFGIAHHEASEFIIRGNGPLGYPLLQILRRHGVRPDDIVAIVDGHKDPLSDPFGFPINIDTIEGILRCHAFFAPAVLSPQTVLDALVERDIPILDHFWQIKNLVYDTFIGSPLGVLADYICWSYMQAAEESFWKGEYFQTEVTLRRRHPRLFELLRDLRIAPYKVRLAQDTKIYYKKRHFFVDKSQSIRTLRDLPKRYRQSKSEHILELSRLAS